MDRAWDSRVRLRFFRECSSDGLGVGASYWTAVDAKRLRNVFCAPPRNLEVDFSQWEFSRDTPSFFHQSTNTSRATAVVKRIRARERFFEARLDPAIKHLAILKAVCWKKRNASRWFDLRENRSSSWHAIAGYRLRLGGFRICAGGENYAVAASGSPSKSNEYARLLVVCDEIRLQIIVIFRTNSIAPLPGIDRARWL